MISIRVNLAALAKMKEKVVIHANRKYRAQIYKMFDDTLLMSAQFSGDYVSNWWIVTQDDGVPAYQEWANKGSVNSRQQPLSRGDPTAIDFARSRMTRKPFSYKDKVYFVNPTPLEFTAMTVTGPKGDTRPLRPENVIPGGVTVKQYLKSKYGKIS